MGAEKNLLKAIGTFCLCFWALAACAKSSPWDKAMAAGQTARQRGDYSEAEKQFSSALREAEGFGGTDPRLPATLSRIALSAWTHLGVLSKVDEQKIDSFISAHLGNPSE